MEEKQEDVQVGTAAERSAPQGGSGSGGNTELIFWIINILAFLLYVAGCIYGLAEFKYSSFAELLYEYKYDGKKYLYKPFHVNRIFIYIIGVILLVLSLYVALMLILKCIIPQAGNLTKKILQDQQKFVFVPVIMNAIMFLIVPEKVDKDNRLKQDYHTETRLISTLLLSIISVAIFSISSL